MKYLSLKDCLQLERLDRTYHNLSAGQVNSAFQKAFGRNATGGEVSQWTNEGGFEGDPGVNALVSRLNPSAAISSQASAPAINVPSFSDVLNSANQLNTTLQQNIQPSINTLQGNVGDINQTYQDLVASIREQTDVAEQAQTRATNTNLGARGIDINSGLGQTELAQGLQPYEASKQTALAQAEQGKTANLLTIAQGIANLQNTMPSALSSALGFSAEQYGLAGYQAQANAAVQAAQLALQGYQAEANKPFAVGGNIYNPSTGKFTTSPLGNLPTVGNSSSNNNITNQPAGNLPSRVQNTPIFPLISSSNASILPLIGGYVNPFTPSPSGLTNIPLNTNNNKNSNFNPLNSTNSGFGF